MARPAPGLPEDVLDRLGLSPSVRITAAGGEGDAAQPASSQATAAPLQGVLYVLIAAGGAVEAALLAHPGVEVVAEGSDARGPWHLRVTGRGLAGRTVSADPRRNELVHWLPEGARPDRLIAVRVLPETLEYDRVTGAGRQRAAGPIPGAEPPASRLAAMSIHGSALWMPVLGAGVWGGLLFWVPPPQRNLLLLAIVLGTAAALYLGIGLLGRWSAFLRWRSGHLRDEDVSDWLDAPAAPDQVRRVGLGALGGGIAFALLLALVGGRELALTPVLASGIWLFGPVHATRYLFRQTDSEDSR